MLRHIINTASIMPGPCMLIYLFSTLSLYGFTSLQDNDIFAVINGVPAFSLCLYGFLTPGFGGGLCFGAGLGITLFGIMSVHMGTTAQCHNGYLIFMP